MTTLRTPRAIRRARPGRRRASAPSLEAVAARYAVAITPAMAELIDRNDPDDPIARQFVPDAAELDRAAAKSAPIRSATTRTARSRASCIAIPTACCSSSTHVCAVYCRFCFRREMVGPGQGQALSPQALDARARLHPRASGDLGGDPHRRRSAGAVAAPAARRDASARRNRPRQGRAHAHARAGGRARAHHAPSWCGR